jgi:lysophospholipase L1-like esterase
MKARIALLAVLFGLLTFTLTLSASEPQFKSPTAKLELKSGDSIVFLGDSITHQCLYTQYVEDFFYTRYPSMRLKFHNSGVGGAKAWDALARFDRDVTAYKPKYVTVLLGMNDGRYQPYDEETFQTYRRDMTEVIARIRKIGATPVLMTPTMFDSRAARMRNRQRSADSLTLYNSVLAYYGTWLREVAVDNGYGFVDMYGPLNNLTLEQRKTDPRFTMIRDSVHPDPPGQIVMAYSIIDQMGLRSPLSNIRITRQGNGKFRVQGTRGKATELAGDAKVLSFTWQAEGLPFVVPAEAQSGAKLLHMGHRMSREALEVHGLPTGRYELSIDGDVVGTYSSLQLERHIELQENTNTPQYKQAFAVAELNKQRNSGPVKSLRNEWRAFQQHARLAAQLKDSPDNDKLNQQVASLAKRLEGIEERIKQHEQDALKLEDQIFKINQPQPRKYQLKKVVAAANAEVSGRVTFNGVPLDGASVEFHTGKGVFATGTTDQAGRYLLRRKGKPAVLSGKFAVTISKKGVPARYSERAQSTLTVVIGPGAAEINFNLTE